MNPICISTKLIDSSPVPQTGVPDVHHSTFESLRLGRSSQPPTSSLLRFPELQERQCSSMYKITDHPFLIRFISPTIDEVITGAPEINLQS
ncbi:hypothetical protein DY000_02023026 [Brassica cretica]|uniref:Uncharacterized protein n=1 Tax=Brassica cretica TaxID=69181 RepID=A0ABQ7EDP4_BRACR|nr:hypothetical protein DY000_02023026 [Brassica cretica]